MAVINISKGDLLKAKVAEKGPYSVEITEITAPAASKSGKSINSFVTYVIANGPLMGKELREAFSSGTENSGLLGDMNWRPMGAFAQVKAAIESKPAEEGPLDTDDLLHRPFDILLDIATSDSGNLVNVITRFLPAGMGTKANSVPF